MPRTLQLLFAIGSLVALARSASAGAPAAPSPAGGDEQSMLSRFDLSDQYLRFPDRIRDSLGPALWLPDGDRFVYWSARSHEGGGTFVVVDAARQTSTPVLSVAALQAQLARALSHAVPLPWQLTPTLSPDRRAIVFALQGRAFALGLDDGHLTALAATDLAALALTPGSALAPDRRSLALPRGNGFAVVGSDGRTLIEEQGEDDYEWQIPKDAWSPDSRHLLVWRNDARGTHKIPIVDYTSALERVTMVPYTKVGTPLVRAEPYLVEPATRRVTRVSLDAAESYDWLAGWRPDGSAALLLQLSRDGKRLDLRSIAPADGKSHLLVREERPESFVGALDFATGGWALQVLPLDDNRRFLWMSERDGWRHVYLYDYAGKLLRQVTKGAFVVHEVVGVVPGGDALLVLASADHDAPYDRALYRVGLGDGAWARLSPAQGLHRIVLAPSRRYYIDAYSSRSQPRLRDVVATDGSARFRYSEADVSALASLHYAAPEAFTSLASDGKTPLYGVLYKPWDFDARKRYAVIDCIYAGPFMTVVPWSFVGTPESMLANALAQLGFVTMVLDARGTPGRSKAFQDVNYGRIGQTEIPDHVAALRQAAATRPYMDLGRAGIVGHSWGGYFALRGMLTAPDFFRAGYAGAPGALEEEAIINEPNLGLPKDNPSGYRAGSNLLIAGNLRGALKIMHGTSDVSASLSTTMRMAQALIRAGKHFELLIMPGETHNPSGAAAKYYTDDVRRFFVRELGPPR